MRSARAELAVAATGGALAAAGRLDPGMLPLLTLLAMASFVPVWEIARWVSQLAETLGAVRRLRAIEAGNRQADAGAAEAARGRLVRLREGIEDGLKLVAGNADAGIGDAEAQTAGSPAAMLRSTASTLQTTLPCSVNFRALLTRLAQDLIEPHGIGGDAGRDLWRDVAGEVDVFAGGARREQAHHLVGDGCRFDGEFLQLQPAGLDLGEIENVVDDGEQALPRADDDVGVPLHPVGQVARRQQARP